MRIYRKRVLRGIDIAIDYLEELCDLSHKAMLDKSKSEDCRAQNRVRKEGLIYAVRALRDLQNGR